MKIGGKIAIYATILVVSFGVTFGIMYGVRPEDPYAETKQDVLINNLFDTLEASQLEGSVVVNSNGEDTVIDFTGTLGLDINNLDTDSIYADLVLDVYFPYGSYLSAGLQFEDSVIYLEYNLGQENEIDMYMDINCLDDISFVTSMLGVDLSLEGLLGDIDLDEIGDALSNMKYQRKNFDTDPYFVLSLFGADFYIATNNKYDFLGPIWSTIETNSGYVDIDITITPYEGSELVSVPYSASWVPLDTLVSALGGTLTYTYYEFKGDFTMEMLVTVDLDELVSGLNLGVETFDVVLGFENLVFKMDLSSGFTMALDYDVKMTSITYSYSLGSLTIPVTIDLNGNSNTHYYTDANGDAATFGSTTLISRHQSIYYDSSDPYIYVTSTDDLTLKQNAFSSTDVSGQDVKYGKFSSSYFFNNIMDIIIYDLLGISDSYAGMIGDVLGDTDLSSISFDVSNTFWENLIPSFTYNEAYTEEIYDEDGELVSSDNIPERYILDVDLGTLLGDDPLLNDIIVEIDLGEHKYMVLFTMPGIDRIYVGANIFGADIAIDLTVDYDNCSLLTTSIVPEVQDYIAAHTDDEENTWYYDLCYQEDSPYSAS